MKKEYRSWYSDRLHREMHIRVYGHTGTPLLILPTQDSMCDNFENFGMIDTVASEIEAGKIQLFAVDTVDKETWSNAWGDKGWRAWQQENYYNYLIEEVLPFIRQENGTGRLPIAVGCSLGGLHAAIVFFRRPELFGGMMSLSGVYDAKFFYDEDLKMPLDAYVDRLDEVVRAVGKMKDAARRPLCATS